MPESFKEYRARKKNTPKSMETCFGSHSIQKPLTEAMYTSPTDADHDRLHNEVAPLDTSKLNKEHMDAIASYTTGSTMLNNYLHNKHNGKNAAEVHKKEANTLTDALDKQKIKAPISLYTGILKSPSEHFAPNKDGSIPNDAIVHLPAFTSTSTSRRKAGEFSRISRHKNDTNHGIKNDGGYRHVLKIQVPSGASGASVRGQSNMDHENEVLLNRGHNISIDKQPEDIGNNTMLWHAKLISHTPASLD